MGIEEKINADVKASMLAKDSKRLEAVRAIKSVILLLKTSPEGLTEDNALKAIQHYTLPNDDLKSSIFTSGLIVQFVPSSPSAEILEASETDYISDQQNSK